MQKIRDLMNMETVRVCLDFWKENGLKALLVKSKHKLQGIDNDYDYGEWYSLTKPTAEELEEQRKKVFDAPVKFSIVIPAFKTPERFLREMLGFDRGTDIRKLGGLRGGRQSGRTKLRAGAGAVCEEGQPL